MSFRYPVDNVRITQPFGANPADYAQYGYKGHNGVDLGVPTGTPVYAADEGTITFEGWGQNHSWMGAPAGICVLINNGGLYSGYAHFLDTVVNRGQRVVKGQLIGHADTTGAASGPHVHFEALPLAPNFKNGYGGRIDPTPYIENSGGDNVAVKINLDTARIVTHGVLARNGLAGRQNSLDGTGDGDLNANHVGKDLTNEYIQGLFLSDEGRNWRDTTNDQSIPGINIKLSNYPNLEQQVTRLTAENEELKKNQGGIDQETRDKINQTFDNTNWIKALLDRIFK